MDYANKQDLMDFIERFGGTSVDPSSILDSLKAMSTETGPYGLSLTGERPTYHIPDRIKDAVKSLRNCINHDVGSEYSTFEALGIANVYKDIIKETIVTLTKNNGDPCAIALPLVCATETILGPHNKNLKMRVLGNENYQCAVRNELDRLTNEIYDISIFHKNQKNITFKPREDEEVIEVTPKDVS